MTVVQGGISGVGADVGAVSKGLYAELIDAQGHKFAPGDCYAAFVDIAPTTLVDGTAYWFMRNVGARDCLVRRIELTMGFTGAIASSMSSYRFERFATATPTGGTVIVPFKMKNTYGATSMTVGFLSAGLAVAGVTFEPTSSWRVAHMNQLQALACDLDMTGDGEGSNFELATGEGLIIRANGAVVAGSRMTGGIYWQER